MSSESNAAKWLVGCAVAGFFGLLICAGAFGLLFYGTFNAARQVAQVAQAEMQEQTAQMQFASQWRPPSADAGADTLFPEAIGGWRLAGHDDTSVIPELGIEKDGHHGTYESVGTKIDVYVYQVPIADQAQTFDDAWRAIEQAGYSTRTSQNMDLGTVHWMPFSFTPPERHGRMWWAQDWLIITMTDNSAVNLKGFERDYAIAIQGPQVPLSVEELGATVEDAAPLETLPVEAAPADPGGIDAPSDPSETAPSDPDAPADPQQE